LWDISWDWRRQKLNVIDATTIFEALDGHPFRDQKWTKAMASPHAFAEGD
jgi:hypothetical protein